MPTQILTTLEYLGLYPDSAGVAAHHFGMTVQVAATVAKTVTPAMESLYKPWTWQNINIQIWPVGAGGALGAPLPDVNIIPANFIDGAGNSVSAGPVDDAILVELNTQYSDAFEADDFLWNDPQSAPDPNNPKKGPVTTMAEDRTVYPWPGHLAQLSRYPFPVPHLLNLSYIVRVDPATPIIVSATQSYVAAVSFTTTATAAAAAVVYSAVAAGAVVTASRYSLAYTSQADTTCLSTALTMSAAAPDRLVPPVLEPTDWQTHLTAGAADLFDFAARLIRPVRAALSHDAPSPVNPQSPDELLKTAIASDFGSLCYAVLCAERDIVSYGINAGPNGQSLFDQLCAQWVSESPDKTTSTERACYGAQLKAVLTTTEGNDSDEVWLKFLRLQPGFAGNPILALPAQAATYDPTAAYPANAVVTYAGLGYTAPKAIQPGPRPPAPAATLWSTYPTVQPAQLNARLQSLEHLQMLFTQNEVLAKLLFALWSAPAPQTPTLFQCVPAPVPPTKSTYQDLFLSFKSSATNSMSTWNVRGILLLGNLGASWTTIVASGADKTSLAIAIKTVWAKRYTDRFTSRSGVAGWPFSAALQPYFNVGDAWLTAQISQLLATQAAPVPTRTSEGLALHLDTLSASTAPADDLKDSLRSMSGYCVLLRDETLNGPWRCLNLANPQTAAGAPAAKNLAIPVVVPSPQHIQDQMRRSIIHYNSQPLMAKSPVHGFSDKLLKTDDDQAGRLIDYIHPSVTASAASPMDPAYKIPGLVFNHSYRFVIGMVSNSGALPPKFATPGQPAQLSFRTIQSNFDLQAGTQVQYLRTVQVGELSFQSELDPDSNNAQKIKFPPIPADVQPRAVELFPPPQVQATSAPSPDSPPTAAADPLILLSGYPTTEISPDAVANFTLFIRKPTVDLLTWDRWRAIDAVSATERVNVWARFHTLARRENTKNLLGLDDLAMTQMKVEVDFFNADGTASHAGTNGTPQLVSWGQPTTPSAKTSRVQDPSQPIQLICTALPTGGTQPNPNPPVTGYTVDSTVSPNTINVQLLPGDIARVRLTPTVPAGGAGTGLFAAGICQEKSYTFLVEAANSAMPALGDLQRLFKVTPPLSAAVGSITFQLPLKTLPHGDQVRSATLQTQVWRWDGRPNERFPFGKDLAAPDPLVLKWETNAFATRAATDIDTRPMQLANMNGILTFTANDDLSTELGALYYRSSIEVFNRYGSLVPATNRSVSTFVPKTYFPGGPGGWTRTLVKARLPISMTIPKPAVKFILPLTGTTTTQQTSAASVLVVIQGPWYALAGLAEDIRVKIVRSSKNASQDALEVGPDPIVWTGNVIPTFQNYDAGPNANPPYPYDFASSNYRFHGPIGHTFNLSDTNPLWVNTSFVLDPPLTGGDTMPWTFAEISFLRSIQRDGFLPDPPNGPTGNMESEWTEPVWVQFLPSSFDGIGKDTDLSSCKVDTSGTTVSILNGTNPLSFSQAAPDPNLYFVLLLTEEVPDLLGRKGQERFIDACTAQPNRSIASWTYSGKIGQPIGRILGVQRKPGAAPLPDRNQLWAELFPDPDTHQNPVDSISRIVSISPPILGGSVSCKIDPRRS